MFVLKAHGDAKSGFVSITEVVGFWCKKQQRNEWKYFIRRWRQILRQRQRNPGQSIKKVGLEEGGSEVFSHAAPITGPTAFYAE